MKFIDEVKIYVSSGKGGDGCIAFRREKFIPFGGPDGGDGGRGGSVILRAAEGLNTLVDFRYQQHFKAKKGQQGGGDNCHGANAPDMILPVPVGTQVFEEDGETLIGDLTRHDQIMVLAKGGDGGFGNAHFKSSTNQAPRKKTPGWPGEEFTLRLRLKLLSDAGLVGMPNAGKSTFLAAVSNAKPKIADYPFTTLTPQLGVVRIDDREFVLADIPGLIEGAHEGVGLGTRFLGHIERCGVLLHLVDATQDDVALAYKTIRTELKAYGEGLAEKTEILALNKCDALTEEEITLKRKALKKAAKKEPLLISGVSHAGVSTALRALMAEVEIHRAAREAGDA